MDDYNAHQLNTALQKIDPSAGVFMKRELDMAPLDDDEEEEVKDEVRVGEPIILESAVLCDDLDLACEVLGAIHNVGSSNTPVEFTAVSAMPFFVGNRAGLRECCPNLFIGSEVCSMRELHRQLQEAMQYNQRLYYTLNRLATRVLNETLTTGLGIRLTVDDFTGDWPEVPDYIRSNYSELYDAFIESQRTMYKRIAILADSALESHYLRFTAGSLEQLTNSGILVKDHTVVLQDSKSQTAIRKEQLSDDHRKQIIDNTVVMLNTHYVSLLPLSSDDLDIDLGGEEPAIITRAVTSALHGYIEALYKRSKNDRLPATDVCLVDWNGQRLYLNETFFDDDVFAVMV
jgi:hypothetical protein